ncbi:hypothetical protein Leryth_025387 [Lithospermum erythrorhizon]|nr:hypothetical protein Leryth_025387 [Lithospermum erythrorhizon]
MNVRAINKTRRAEANEFHLSECRQQKQLRKLEIKSPRRGNPHRTSRDHYSPICSPSSGVTDVSPNAFGYGPCLCVLYCPYWSHDILYFVLFGERVVSSLGTNHGSTQDIELIFGFYMILVLKKTSNYLLYEKLYVSEFEVCFVFEACFWSMKIKT